MYIHIYICVYIYIYMYIYIYIYIYIWLRTFPDRASHVDPPPLYCSQASCTPSNADTPPPVYCSTQASCTLLLAIHIPGQGVWPLRDILRFRGFCARINHMFCKLFLGLSTPLPPFIAHTIAQHTVSPPTPHFCYIYRTILAMTIFCVGQHGV